MYPTGSAIATAASERLTLFQIADVICGSWISWRYASSVQVLGSICTGPESCQRDADQREESAAPTRTA